MIILQGMVMGLHTRPLGEGHVALQLAQSHMFGASL